jgi:hypothetical protein
MINLIYIRAAILDNTGISLSLDKTLQYLVEEGLVTSEQAKDDNMIFRGYSEFFETEEAATLVESVDHLVYQENENEEVKVRGI